MAQLFYDPSKLTDEQKAFLESISISQQEDLQNRMNEYLTSGQRQRDIEAAATMGKSIL